MGHYDNCYEAEEERDRVGRQMHNNKQLTKILALISDLHSEMIETKSPQKKAIQQADIKLNEFEFWLREAIR